MCEIVTFELAKKLKEKGFKQGYNTFGYNPVFSDENTIKYIRDIGAYETEYFGINVPCPNIYQVLKWLREEKDIHIEPCILADADTDADGKVINEFTYWSFIIMSIANGDMIYFEYEHIDDKRFDSYEEATIDGIEYVIDNLI
jgi:hypothetical protein